MPTSQSLMQLLRRLWHHIPPKRRRQFGLLLFLMLIASIAEIINLGAVLPFLGVLTAPERIFAHPAAQPFIHAFGIATAREMLLPLSIFFGIAALFAAAMRMLLLWCSIRLSFVTGSDLSNSVYRRTLYQPYSVHCSRNSSEVISGISNKTGTAIGVISHTLSILSAVGMLAAILFALVAVEPVIALTAFTGFGLIYLIIIRLTRNRLLIDSQRIARESTNVIRALQEGLGGIRDILLDGSQGVYCQIYRDADYPLRRAHGNNQFLGASPRYFSEAFGMLLIVGLAYALSQQADGVSKAIPILGTLALGAQRLLPVLQQAYAAWSSIRGSHASLQDTLELLEQPLPDYLDRPSPQSLVFIHEISLNDIGFRYSDQMPFVLHQFNLRISKGSRVGFIGATGSGKSTLLDIVMGLLPPTEGTLEIDGQVVTSENYRAWQAHIAHVPQAIFLTDRSIEENIAFGTPKGQIDHQKVKQAARQAQIADTIENWPNQYETVVGERGIRLSGGQRQRIGIARALYKESPVIVFDEATSALDNDTEKSVMQAIDNLKRDLTILIVAHRLSTIQNCDNIVELRNGGIARQGTYDQLFGKSESA